MIYKFIDNNGSEITVNSLSSLQALVDSETVKENTKVKAGLRGKWTTASNIDELVFAQEVEEEAEHNRTEIVCKLTQRDGSTWLEPRHSFGVGGEPPAAWYLLHLQLSGRGQDCPLFRARFWRCALHPSH